ncbi:MAG: polymerase-binding protein DksA [Pseudomonadota bacterium]
MSKHPAPRASSAKAPIAKAGGSPSKAKPAAKQPAAKAAPAKSASHAKPAPVKKPVVTAKKTVVAAPPAATKKTAPKSPAKPATKAVTAAAPSAPKKPVAAPAPVVRVAPVVSAPAVAAPPSVKKSASKKHAVAPAPTPISLLVRDLPPAAPSRQMTVIEDTKSRRKVDPKHANAWKTKLGRELSEDELFAMPDAEYMNDKQLDFFRAVLMQQRDDLLNNAGETTEHLREDTSIVPDPADRATIEEEHALELRTRDRERKLLKKISQSISRIDASDYGYCDETGEPIGLGRLLARPTATLSLEAQQRREMKQKMFGD